MITTVLSVTDNLVKLCGSCVKKEGHLCGKVKTKCLRYTEVKNRKLFAFRVRFSDTSNGKLKPPPLSF